MVATPLDGLVHVFYFAEALPGAGATRLAAAVAWRLAPGDAPLGRRGRGGRAQGWGRGPVAWVRRLRYRLWRHFGPLGIDLHVLGRPVGGGGGGLQGAGFALDDEPAVYYDGRVVRTLGRVYRLPRAARTLVLLVDEGGREGAAPRIRVRTLPAPVVATPSPAPPWWANRPADVQTDVLTGGHDAAWAAALRADPEVRAFLDGGARE